MMRILYIITKTITLPGAIIHAFFEHMTCRWTKVIVDDARTVQFNEMLGHVDHELVKRKGASFDICFVPFFFSFCLGFLLLMNGSTSVYYFGRYDNAFAWISLYLGVSIWASLFPQVEDVMMLKENFFQKGKNKISKIILIPFYVIFFIGARIEKWGLSLLTAVGFSFLVPTVLGWFVPSLYELLK